MKEIFVKKYWQEENITFYLYFQNGEVVAQVEISPNGKVFLSKDLPLVGDSMLYDQALDELELEKEDFITKDAFMEMWNDQFA